jgi:hypothetical protein
MMAALGAAAHDRYVADDDLGASIDLDADAEPDFVSTDVGRVVLRGGGGADLLAASAAPHDVTGAERTTTRRHA